MPSLSRIALLAVVMPLGSCVTKNGSMLPPVPDGHNFSYAVPNHERIHLTQAFDDGSKTYLQFDDPPTSGLDIRDPEGDQAVAYTVDQRFVIVPGVYGALQITVAGASSIVVNRAPAPTPGIGMLLGSQDPNLDTVGTDSMAAAVVSEMTALPAGLRRYAAADDPVARSEHGVPVRVSMRTQSLHGLLRLAELKQEVSRLEENVRLLTAEIEAAHRQGVGDNVYLRSVGGEPRVVMQFGDNRVEAHVDERVLGAVAGAARAAPRVYLHGRTDASAATTSATDLALRRAVEVRRLLVSQHVDPEHIRIFYRGAGGFAADNSTAEGRALNRRVEIELRKW
jgi:outer membrane protein OmpA-like peptidoglycan-associated protein